VRARANVLGFGVPGKQFGIIAEDDDDDDDEGIAAVGQADPDILPTILAYYNGELEKTWVRVDFELRDDGLAGLLYR
jgi:hypothetical protein